MSCPRIRSALVLLFAVVAIDPLEAQGAPARFDIQGHRGARGLAPENTLPAFEIAIIQSKWGEVLAAVRECSPDLERSLVVRIARAQPWVEEGTATIVSRKHVFLWRREVGKLQQQGVRVIPWTANKSGRIQKLMEWGVDGVITDYPDRALALIAE